MLLEKLTIKDTFRIWRDKINALMARCEKLPYTDDKGNYIIDLESTNATKFVVDIPAEFKGVMHGELTGNASTATRLQSDRKINGRIFNGTEDIVTPLWGEATSISIADATGDNVGEALLIDGSKDNYVLRLPDNITTGFIGTADYAKALAEEVHVNGIVFDGSQHVVNYGVCKTPSSNPDKEVTIILPDLDFVLATGAVVTVKFMYEHTDRSKPLTLNVNGTGKRYIYSGGTNIDPLSIIKDAALSFVYDGDNYLLVSSVDKTVTQNKSTTNAEYPVLLSLITDPNVLISNEETLYSTNVTINPSTNAISTTGSIYTKEGLIIGDEDTGGGLTVYGDVYGHGNAEFGGNLISTTGSIYTKEGLTIGDEDTGGDLTVYGDVYGYGKAEFGGNLIANMVYNAVWNDYAEFFPKGEETEPGDIVALDTTSKEERYVKATSDSKLVVGIHSDTYGHILGGEGTIEESKKTNIPVGLAGRVYVNFVGEARLGEGVVSSEIPGVGRLASTNDASKIVGYIVEDKEGGVERRKVKVFIK